MEPKLLPSAKPTSPPAPRPRDAAALILVDEAGDQPRILMGQRRLDLVFLPGKFVFPGGRVAREDYRCPSAGDLRAADCDRLAIAVGAKPRPRLSRALAMAAIREMFEETGLLLGSPGFAESLGGAWRAFGERGLRPALGSLSLFARAITPPSRPRRFDTRFFVAPAAAIHSQIDARDDELSAIGWFTIGELRDLDVAPITRLLVGDLTAWMALGPAERTLWSVPHYTFRGQRFRRTLLIPNGTQARLDT